jgi:hypothetical protein
MIERKTFKVKITTYMNNLRWSADFPNPVTELSSITLLALFTRNYKHGAAFVYQISEEVFIC